MIVVELYKASSLFGATFSAAGIATFKPGEVAAASYWTSTFGAPDESSTTRIFVSQVLVGASDNYTAADSEASCIAEQRTFYWDNTNQTLYVHFPSNEHPSLDGVSIGAAYGYSNENVAYISDVEYLPLVESVPSVAQQQDLFNYNMPSFVSGQVVLNNAAGALDDLIDSALYGSYVRIYSLDSSADPLNYDRSELQLYATFYVEDFEFTLKQLTVKVQDVRKLANVLCPTELFSTSDYPDLDTSDNGKVIPLCYGDVRWTRATCTNKGTTTGDVDYRVAQSLASIGSIYVVNGDSRVLVTPSSTDLATGSFVLASADARDSNGSPREVLVASMSGIANTYATDVIKDLNDRYAGVPYTGLHYDTAEWESEEIQLTAIGMLIKDQDNLYNHIQKVVTGANYGFRYEVNPDGKRTIRIDDWARDSRGYIDNVHILDIDEIPVGTDNEYIAAKAIAKYGQNQDDGTWLIAENVDNETYSSETYNQSQTVTVETLCAMLANAQLRANRIAKYQRDTLLVVEIELLGSEYLDARIYDIFDLELTPDMTDASALTIDGRSYFGFQRAQIIGVDPDFVRRSNTIRAVVGVLQQYDIQTEASEDITEEDGATVLITEG